MNGFNTNFNDLSTSNSFLTIYFSLIIIPTILVLLKFSGKYKGAWIYRAAPIQQLKPMFSGTIKAFLFKLHLPFYLLLSVIFLVIFVVRIVPDLIVVFLKACTFAVICLMILKKSIPFSASFDEYNQNSNVAIFIGLMLFVALCAGIHYATTLFSYGIYLYLVVAIICLGTLWKLAFNITWDKIRG
jgi:ABC-2 type transport system permease protein